MRVQEIEKDLIELGAKTDLIGFKYTARAIKLSFEIYGNTKIKYTGKQGLYAIVAKENNTESSRVERGIRHFVTRLFETDVAKKIENKYGVKVEFEKKPTNSEFISLIATLIEREEIQ